MRAIDVLCIGHASYDISLRADHHPAADEKMSAEAMACCGGGPAANAAVAVARLGRSSALAAYLDNGAFGELHVGELRREGVDTRLVVRGDTASPISVSVAKPDGTRFLINHKVHAEVLPADAVDFSALSPRAILVDGHEPALSRAAFAGHPDVPTVLDAGSVHPGTELLCGQVDYLVASLRFARDYSACTEPAAALDVLAKLAPAVVITLGDQGLLWARNEERGRLPAFDVSTVDSTGAGDAFHGGFAHGLVAGMDWLPLLRYASAVAALSCAHLGARPGLPSAAEVVTFMELPDATSA